MSTTTSRRPISSRALAALAAVLLSAGARADLLHVPGDFPTIAAAVAAAVEGDEIVLAAGSYNDPVELLHKAGITLRGQGKVILGGGPDALTVTECEDIVIDHLSIVAPGNNGVFVADCERITLRRLVVEGAGGEGITGGESSDILVDRCRVEGSGDNGIAWLFANRVTVSRCEVSGSLVAGISFDEVVDSVVERCRVTSPATNGIVFGQADPTGRCSAFKNVILAPGLHGIAMRGDDNNAVGNRVVGASGDGILQFVGAFTGGIYEGNKLVACEDGMLLQAAGMLVRDNRVVKPLAVGISCAASGFVLQDNRVMQCGDNAYQFGGSLDGGAVLGCRAVKSGDDGFQIDGTGLSFTDNLSTGAAENGFIILGDGNLFVGNESKGSGIADVSDLGTANVFLDNGFDIRG